jgi:hypothetical protein
MESPRQFCSCPRKVHPSCLKKWQRIKLGTLEEKQCKFCNEALPEAFDTKKLKQAKTRLRYIEALESLSMVFMIVLLVGPCLIIMYQFSTEQHPCHAQSPCLYVGVGMTLLQVISAVLFCRCIHKWRPQLMKQLADLGVNAEVEVYAV